METYTKEMRQAQIELYDHIVENLAYLETLKLSLDKNTGEVIVQYVSIDDEYYYDFLQATPEEIENGDLLIECYKRQAKQVITDLPIYEFYDL